MYSWKCMHLTRVHTRYARSIESSRGVTHSKFSLQTTSKRHNTAASTTTFHYEKSSSTTTFRCDIYKQYYTMSHGAHTTCNNWAPNGKRRRVKHETHAAKIQNIKGEQPRTPLGSRLSYTTATYSHVTLQLWITRSKVKKNPKSQLTTVTTQYWKYDRTGCFKLHLQSDVREE